jgi:multisubunit Na+/H+ antiporter MnhB subunit
MYPMGIQDPDYFGPSQTDLISAREDILFRRDMDDNQDRRQRMLFASVVFLTIIFPLIGLLALWRMFDSTISWYTYGMRHRLTHEQRAMLKYQLIVEVVLYPVLVIVLAVFFSKHG